MAYVHEKSAMRDASDHLIGWKIRRKMWQDASFWYLYHAWARTDTKHVILSLMMYIELIPYARSEGLC